MLGSIKTMTARKLKVSVTLSADVLALVDRDARRRSETRSGVIEQWLRRVASATIEKEIEHETAAYYEALRGSERVEDEALARGLSEAARRVSYDAAAPRRRRRATP